MLGMMQASQWKTALTGNQFKNTISEDNSLKIGEILTFLLLFYNLSHEDHILTAKINPKETDKESQEQNGDLTQG